MEVNMWFSTILCVYILQLHSNSDKGDGSVKYILTGEGAGTIFIIDDTTGDIHSTKSLDREQKTHYVLHAQAIDRRTNKPLEPESEFIIKVQDINDNAPKFTDGPYIVTVPEMSEMGKEKSSLYQSFQKVNLSCVVWESYSTLLCWWLYANDIRIEKSW